MNDCICEAVAAAPGWMGTHLHLVLSVIVASVMLIWGRRTISAWWCSAQGARISARQLKVLKFSIGAGILLFASVARAQAPEVKKDVAFECTCKTATAQAYAAAFHELLAASPAYEENAGALKLSVVAQNPLPDGDSDAASPVIMSVVILYKGVMMQQWVQSCGGLNVKSCAVQTYTTMDGVLKG